MITTVSNGNGLSSYGTVIRDVGMLGPATTSGGRGGGC